MTPPALVLARTAAPCCPGAVLTGDPVPSRMGTASPGSIARHPLNSSRDRWERLHDEAAGRRETTPLVGAAA